MARGGSFGGGGRGGGFSSGGRSGGFSSGSSGRSGGFSSGNRSSGSFSGSNFSSFKKSSGANTPSKPTSVHTSRNSFLTGALVGSVLSGNRGNNAYYGGMSSNDVFPEVSGSNYKPRRPEPPKGREYMHCEYCGSDYNDLNITKCQNCGAKTTRKREEIKTAGFSQGTATAYSQITTTAQQKSKNKKTVVIIGIVIVLIIIFAAIVASLYDNDSDYDYYEFTPITYEWEGGNNIEYNSTAYFNNWIYGEKLNLKVTSAAVLGSLEEYGIDHNDYYYCVIDVNIVNKSSSSYVLYISDLTLKVGGELYVASSLETDGGSIFSERSEDGYMIIPAGKDFTVTFIFPIYNNLSLSALSLDFREFSSSNTILGAHRIYLTYFF